MAPPAPQARTALGSPQARVRLLAVALLVLGLLLILAALAPVIAAARRGHPPSPTVAAGVVLARLALAPTCHQRAERTFLVGPVRMAACARCTGLYAGSALAGILILAGVRLRRRAGQAVVLSSLVAMGLDVAAGMAWQSWDHPMLRFATGILVVVGVGLGAAGFQSSARALPESNRSPIVADVLR